MRTVRSAQGETVDRARFRKLHVGALGLALALVAAFVVPHTAFAQKSDPSQSKQPPKNSAPQSGPLAGLARPIPRHIATPDVPTYFCSTLERWQWYAQHFASEWLEAAENAEDAFHYRAQVSARAAEHFVKDGDPAQQKILDAEERWADKNAMSHLKARDAADKTRATILGTRVIDCSSKSLTALIAQQQGQITNIDAEIKATENKIKAIGQSIEDTLIEHDLIDAYEHGALWGVAPTTVEHHNILRYISDAQGEQRSLKRGLEQLLKQKAELQNQLNNTTKFADGVTKAGDSCPEQPRTANVSLTATPLDQKPAPAQGQTAGSSLAPEQTKALQENGRDWAAGDYEAEWSFDSASPRYSIQYRMQTRFDSFLKNHPLSEQEKKPFADGYWSAYKDLSDRAPAQVTSPTAAGAINIDPLRHLRAVADAWINSGNAHLQSQGKSLSAQLDQIEKSRQGTAASQSGGSQPISSGVRRWFKVEGQISGLPPSVQPRGFFTTAGIPSFFWGGSDGSAPGEFRIDGNGNFSIDDLWSPADFLKGPPAGSAQDRIELQLGDDRWKVPLVSPLRLSLRNLGQGDSTIYGWNSQAAAVRATRVGPGRTFVAPGLFGKLNIEAFSMQRLSPGCKDFLNSLGAVYSESNHRRGVAPAPSLDPAYWPDAKPEPPVISLSRQP